jgi:energy-coupling factor transporter ATP-binding protein EcfA2
MTARTLPERLEALRGVVELGEGRLDTALLDRAAAVSSRAGERLLLSADHTVVALAGATGSGKSSLFNALAGADVSTVGVRRPTTAYAAAAVWGMEGAEPLLDWLGVPTRHAVNEVLTDELGGLVLLDLPDHDSTALTHRLEVDRLVELVDMLVWVVDPQKYADAALHERYLRRLASHDAVTVVVLNQIDRLGGQAATQTCLADLQRLLREDGLSEASVLGVSARTAAGLGDLRGLLAGAVRRRQAVTARIAADLDRLGRDVTEQAGLASAARPGRIGRRERGKLVDALCDAAGVPAVTAAVGGSYVSGAVGATGWPFTRWVRRLRPDPLRRLHLNAGTPAQGEATARSSLPPATAVTQSRVDSAVRGIVGSVTADLPVWEVEAVRRVTAAGGKDLSDALDRAVSSTDLGLGRRPFWWTALGLLQTALAVATLAGVLWLTLIFGVLWLQLPKPPTPEVRGFGLPTLLALGGALGGLLVAGLGRLLARMGARRRRRRAESRLRGRIDEVAETVVLGPVRQELDAYGSLLDRLALLR